MYILYLIECYCTIAKAMPYNTYKQLITHVYHYKVLNSYIFDEGGKGKF